MAARFPYYLLADSLEGRAKESEFTGVVPSDAPVTNDVKQGFVYERVPHVTLKSIANNPDIREGMSREEIDEAIARHADQELLYDKPYEDRKRVRVTGRFTVESLSPHRVLDPDQERPRTEVAAEQDPNAEGFVPTILANLRKAGVQNTKQGERLVFDTLEPFAGKWIQAEGTFTDKSGESKRVAVSIGPEHGTVGPLHVKEAAKEAVRGVGFDILVVCGFAFDARVGETAREFGDLTVLPARMNPDLMMGDDLLKKTGADTCSRSSGNPTSPSRTRVASWSWSCAASTSTTPPPVRSAPTRRMTSPAGSSTPSTTRRASSFATPTSPAATSPTNASRRPSVQTSTRTPGPPSTPPPAAPSPSPTPTASQSRSSTTTATK